MAGLSPQLRGTGCGCSLWFRPLVLGVKQTRAPGLPWSTPRPWATAHLLGRFLPPPEGPGLWETKPLSVAVTVNSKTPSVHTRHPRVAVEAAPGPEPTQGGLCVDCTDVFRSDFRWPPASGSRRADHSFGDLTSLGPREPLGVWGPPSTGPRS